MTVAEETQSATVRNVERERKKREDALLLLLLFDLDGVRKKAVYAVQHGHPASPVIQSLVAGNASQGSKGIIGGVTGAMARAHRDGFRRAGLTAGTRQVERGDAGTISELMDLYKPQAKAMADAIALTLSSAVDAAVSSARMEYPTPDLGDVIRNTFEARGYDDTASYALEQGVERAIVGAYNLGVIHAGLVHPAIAEAHGAASGKGGASGLSANAVGLAHHTVVDEKTTQICLNRDGLILPATDPYWLFNIPPLHEFCRSIVSIVLGDYDHSTWRPTIPPKPGFGAAPSGFLELVQKSRKLPD